MTASYELLNLPFEEGLSVLNFRSSVSEQFKNKTCLTLKVFFFLFTTSKQINIIFFFSLQSVSIQRQIVYWHDHNDITEEWANIFTGWNPQMSDSCTKSKIKHHLPCNHYFMRYYRILTRTGNIINVTFLWLWVKFCQKVKNA